MAIAIAKVKLKAKVIVIVMAMLERILTVSRPYKCLPTSSAKNTIMHLVVLYQAQSVGHSMIRLMQAGVLYNPTCPATSGLVSMMVASSSWVIEIIFMTAIKFRLSRLASCSTRGRNSTGRLVSRVTGCAMVVGVEAAGCGRSGATTSVWKLRQAASWRRRLKPHPSRPKRPMTCPQHPHRMRWHGQKRTMAVADTRASDVKSM